MPGGGRQVYLVHGKVAENSSGGRRDQRLPPAQQTLQQACHFFSFFANFEFGAKNGRKKAPNDQKWPESLKSDIRNHFHRISASLAVILSGHMTGLQQF